MQSDADAGPITPGASSAPKDVQSPGRRKPASSVGRAVALACLYVGVPIAAAVAALLTTHPDLLTGPALARVLVGALVAAFILIALVAAIAPTVADWRARDVR